MSTLEDTFKQYFKARHALAFGKGRTGLYAILKSLGIGPGDEVVIQAFNCVPVANAVQYFGARPAYCDVAPGTLGMDAQKLRLTEKTKAVIVLHPYGAPAEIEKIRTAIGESKVALIEDCAHAIGSRLDGNLLGTFADASFFSFNWQKPIPAGGGGIVITDREDLAARLKEFQQTLTRTTSAEESALRRLQKKYKSITDYWEFLKESVYLEQFHPVSEIELLGKQPLDYFKAINPAAAEEIESVMQKIESAISHRKRIAEIYCRHFAATSPAGSDPVYLAFPVFVKNKWEVMKEAEANRLEIWDWFATPVDPMHERFDRVGYRPGECPEAERAANSVVLLPTHQRINPSTANKTAELVKLFL